MVLSSHAQTGYNKVLLGGGYNDRHTCRMLNEIAVHPCAKRTPDPLTFRPTRPAGQWHNKLLHKYLVALNYASGVAASSSSAAAAATNPKR